MTCRRPAPSPRSGCGRPSETDIVRSLDQLIADYQARYGEDRAKSRLWWSSARSPEEALTRAFYDWEEGEAPLVRRLNSHQFRLGYVQVGRAMQAAQRHLPLILSATEFDSLLTAFSAIWRIEGVFLSATLLTYDVAERFGHYRGLYPEQVYLHAGAAEGARALGIWAERTSRNRFGPSLGALDAAEIENFLCICKADLSPELLER